jgi:hypothetical protein
MGEPDRVSGPFSRAEYEVIYWAVLDFLTLPDQPSATRRGDLRRVLDKLSDHVRHLRSKAGSGVHKRVNVRDVVRERLLGQRNPEEESIWSVYAEEPDTLGNLVLLTVTGGKYREVVEFALDQPEFITHGMGGQIDQLGE